MKIIELFIPKDTSIDEFMVKLIGDRTDEVEVIECPVAFLSPNLEWDCFKRVRIIIQEMPNLWESNY